MNFNQNLFIFAFQMRKLFLKKHLILSSCFFLLASSNGFSLNTFNRDDTSITSEEVSYDQLVRELNSRVHRQERTQVESFSGDVFDNLQIHISLGMVQTLTTLSIQDHLVSRLDDGIQLGIGIDLFSREWIAEGVLKNYGQSKWDDKTMALREFDLRLSYLHFAQKEKVKIRFSNGLGARNLKWSSLGMNFSQYQTTPVYLIGLGVLVPIGTHFDLDIEAQGHASLINETVDRHGLSFILRLNNTF